MPSLNLCPSSYQKQDRNGLLSTPIGSGPVQVRNTWTGDTLKLGAYDLQFDLITKGEKESLETLYDTTLGGASSFDWTAPNESTQRTYRFTSPLTITAISDTTWNVSFGIAQTI